MENSLAHETESHELRNVNNHAGSLQHRGKWSKYIEDLYLVNKNFDERSLVWNTWIKGITKDPTDESAYPRRLAAMEAMRAKKQAELAQMILGSAHRTQPVLATNSHTKDSNDIQEISSITLQVKELVNAIKAVKSTSCISQQLQCLSARLLSLRARYRHALPLLDIDTSRKALIDDAACCIDDVLSSNDLNDLRTMLAWVHELDGEVTSSKESLQDIESRLEKCKQEFGTILLSVSSSAPDEDALSASLEHQIQEMQNESRLNSNSSSTPRSAELVDHYIGNFMNFSQGINLTPVQQYKDLLVQLGNVKTQYEQLASICSPTIHTNQDPFGTTRLQ